MKIMNAVSLATMLLALAGCATHAPGPEGKAPTQPVPQLKVLADCGACQVNPRVPQLIVDGYTEAATKAGATISPELEATASIKGYSAREDVTRFLIGAFAGKDEIKADVRYKDRQFSVEDYYYNAWLGIESLAQKIGELIFEQVKQ